MGNWLTIDEASKYLGIGKTVLYTLARETKIPCSKVGKKWLFEKAKLDSWVRANKPIDTFFISTNYNIDENAAVREPQLEGYQALYEFFKTGGHEAIVQIPVGCGKSGLAALIPFGIAHGRVLIISPNLTIKEGLFESFDVTNRQKCFWRQRGILDDEDMVGGPFSCTLDDGNLSVCEKSHIVITNIHQLSTNVDKWLNQFPDSFFDLIIVDEAHHSAAESWKKVFSKFPDAKIVHMTATPFRSDSQEIKGELVYRYSFRSATIKGYIKKLTASYVAPAEITFSAKGAEKTYTLDEVLKLKEETWFSRGIALSEVCNISIVDNSLKKLEELRMTGTRHQLIAVACSIDHARSIRSLYAARNYKAAVIHSNLSNDEKDTIIRDLKNGTLDCIIQVQMLGEGFDHPKLSVAAIFRPFRSLAPYIQFVGRILRVIVQNDPTHPDNYGHIVTHVGMNLDQRLKEFKQFENDDQEFWEKVIGGKEPEPARAITEGDTRLRVNEPIVANHEIVDCLIEEDFTSPEDEQIIQELAKKLESLGLDPKQARELVLTDKRTEKRRAKPAEPFTVLPQNEWKEAKKRLNEKVKHTAKILLNRVELSITGKELPYKYKSLGIQAVNNFTACVMMINQEIKKMNSNERQKWTTENFKEIDSSLEDIVNQLTRRIKKAQSISEESK